MHASLDSCTTVTIPVNGCIVNVLSDAMTSV